MTSRLGQSDILRAGAIDVDVEGRMAGGLLDARVGDAGNMAHPAQQQIGVVEIRREIGAANLQSIGAGAPKLRIWLTMSAGRNANVTPGN